MARIAKKEEPLPVVEGIRGVLRKYLLKEMIDTVAAPYKILVMDEEGSRIINSCFKMHHIMEHGVTLVVNIAKARQPVKSCCAIYFVGPSAANAEAILKDWAAQDMYKEGPRVYFTTVMPEAVAGRLAQPSMIPKIKELKDMRISFMSTEHLVFNTGLTMDLQTMYGTNYSGLKVNEAAERLASALLIAGERPAIRCYNNELCKTVAEKVKAALAAEESSTAVTTGTLIIVDRALDMIAPLVHEFTYEAFLQDAMPLAEGNVLEIKSGKDTRKALIDTDDDAWCAMRHQHLGKLGSAIEERFKILGERFPNLMKFSQEKAGASTKDLGDAVRDLPAFNAIKLNIGTHQYLIGEVMKTNTNSKLQTLGELEQSLILGLSQGGSKLGAKEQIKIIADVLKSNDYSPSVKKRFAMLGVAVLGPDKLDEIAKLPGLNSSDRIGLEAIAKHFNVAAKDKAARNKKDENSEFFVSSFKTYVKQVMEQAAAGTLDQTTFPYVSGDAQASALSEAAASGPVKTGLFARPKTATAAGKSTASSAKPVANLDLGHGHLVPITSHGRIWIYVLGGVTYSEIRSAYEVTAASKKEVVIGSTSIIRSGNFVEALASMT